MFSLIYTLIRNFDGFNLKKEEVERILNWKRNIQKDKEVAFKPSRVILQDFTEVPLVADLAEVMRSQTQIMGPVDLVIQHYVQIDFHVNKYAREQNEQKKFERNLERFEFLNGEILPL